MVPNAQLPCLCIRTYKDADEKALEVEPMLISEYKEYAYIRVFNPGELQKSEIIDGYLCYTSAEGAQNYTYNHLITLRSQVGSS